MYAFEAIVRTPEREIDLARAALLIARLEQPALDPEPWLARLDDLAVASGAGSVLEPCAALCRLLTFLFREQGFRGNAEDYFDARNSCLDQVLERKLGIPITLSLLTMEIARRVGLTVDGIGLPGHFVVRARLGRDEAVLLDPFHGGAVLSQAGAADVVARALGQPVPLTPAHFQPVSKHQLLARMLANLKSIYVRREEWTKALAVIDRLLLFEDGTPTQLRDRGTVLMKLGDFHAGAAEWERYLTRCPHARDADRLRDQLRQIRQVLASRN